VEARGKESNTEMIVFISIHDTQIGPAAMCNSYAIDLARLSSDQRMELQTAIEVVEKFANVGNTFNEGGTNHHAHI
jgi:hypothetical protein